MSIRKLFQSALHLLDIGKFTNSEYKGWINLRICESSLFCELKNFFSLQKFQDGVTKKFEAMEFG